MGDTPRSELLGALQRSANSYIYLAMGMNLRYIQPLSVQRLLGPGHLRAGWLKTPSAQSDLVPSVPVLLCCCEGAAMEGKYVVTTDHPRADILLAGG